MKNSFKNIIFLLLLMAVNVAYGQFVPITNCPTIKINSGNPTFPFPQFLEYAAGKSLAKNNAEGVTHADMEKTMREAYEIMSHRCRLTGQTFCGVPYINFNNSTVPHNYNTFVSEGDGYMLIAAAMFADQNTFNGLWMWIHDNRMSRIKKYKDCTDLRPTQKTGEYIAGWKCDETTAANDGDTHSASDGDFDIAMGLLIAYKQWGEFMYHNGTLVKDACGNPISYKLAAEKTIKALVDTIPDIMNNGAFAGYMSGVIGVDGYVKSGNTWGELTMWRATQATYPWAKSLPTLGGNYGSHYIDYNSPGYFNQFAKFLTTDGNGNAWQINQFKRAEASSDFLVNEAYKQGYIASIGKVNCATDGTFTFTSFNSGEDFRFAWKSLIGYLWQGNPTTSWDPVNHQVKAGGNTFEKDMAIRHATMLREPKAGGIVRCKKMGASPDPGQPLWWGVAQIPQGWDLNGNILEQAGSNYALGTGSISAVASENLELLSDMYRQSELVWDDASTESKNLTDDQRYIQSTPKYFHGIFRVLGLLTNSGNMHAPEKMVPAANMKVYMSVDKTYAYQEDKIEYKVSYRNYGSLDAQGVKITTVLDNDYQFVSASDGGTISGKTITWNIGKVTGFKSGGLAATMDSLSFIVIVKDTLNKRVCLQSTLTATNCESWTSNEYPNRASYTMERNCVDILASRSLLIKKTANRKDMNPNDIVKFTIDFENKSSADSWLNGGRKNVYMSYGNYLPAINDNGDWSNTSFYQFYRFWHDGSEAYINMKNYRVSYFMNDINKGFQSATNPNGWLFGVDNQNDMDKYGYNPTTGPITFAYQKIPAGEDANGKWNQRIMIQFADVLTAPSTHVYDKLDSKYLLHKGVFGPGFIRSRLYTNPATNMKAKVSDDWSYDAKLQNIDLAAQGSLFSPITPGWADYSNPNLAINNYARHSCSPNVDNFDRILVEEFDGYTWRRIQGRGPLPGKEAYNVVIVDTIPKQLKWKGFIDTIALTKYATYTPAPTGANYTGIVKWTIDEMLVGETGNLVYEAIANDINCPTGPDVNFSNSAWISSQTDSPDSSKVNLKTTCVALPPIIDPQASLFKFASKATATTGDNITYKLKYINTAGTVMVGNLSSQTGWKKLGTGNLPLAKGYFSGDPNANTGVPAPYFFSNDKSYGLNGTLETTWDCGNSSVFYLVFRYTSGTPYQSDFKGVCLKVTPLPAGQGTIKFEVLDGTTVIATETANTSYPTNAAGTFNPINFKIKLLANKMYVYVNDTETVLKSYSGLLTTTPGYIGVYSGSGGNQQKMTAFKTTYDYAFDIKLFDNLPVELGNITSISNSGVWDQTKKTITWPVVPGPMKPNDSLVYTFKADVVSCNKFITNLGITTVYGKDTLKVLNTVTCGGTPLCSAPTSVTITASPTGSVCDGTTIALTAAALPTGTSWMYAFKKATTTVGTGTSYNANTAGSYTVIAYDTKDSATCSKTSAAVTVAINPLPTIVATASPTKICVGALSTISVSGGTSYSWDNSLGTVTSKAVSPSITTTYKVTGTDANGCVNTASVVLTVNALPTITVTATPTIVCPGGTASLVAGGGTSYSWSNTLGTGTPKTVTPASSTTYSITGTDANTSCSNTANVIVGVSALPTVTLTALPTIICKGTTSTLTAAGATTYIWSGTLPAGTSNIVSPTVTTSYFVTGTLAGCTATATTTVSLFTSPTISITATPTLVCAGTATSLKGNGGTNYTWNNALGTGTTISATPSANTTYIVTGTDANGCSGTASTAISYTNPPVPTGLADKSVTIGGVIPPLSVTATGIVKWYDATGTTLLATGISSYTPPSSIVNTVGVGSYPFQITNTVNGCESPQVTETIFVTGCTVTAVTPSATTQTICQGAPFTAITASGTTIKWYSSNQTTILGTGTSYTPTGAGDIYVSQTNVCEGPKTKITISVNALPTISTLASLTNVCAGNSTTITASGGNTYIWNNSLGTTSIIVTPTVTSTYSVTGTDVNACKGTASISISYTNPALPTASDVSISVNAVVPAMNAAGTLITWYNAAGTIVLGTGAYTPIVSTTNPGTYPYKITNTVNGCESAQVTVVLNVTSCSVLAPTVNLTTQSTCQGKPFVAFTATGTAITWYSSDQTTVVGTGASFTPTSPGDYYASQTIVCEGPKAKVTAIQNVLPSVIATATPSNICVGQSSTISVSGGSSYIWSNASTLAIQSVSPAATKTYSVTGTDANTCSNTATVIVSVTALPTISISPASPAVCPGKSQVLTASGATTYIWDNFLPTTASVTVSPSITQNYSVTGTSSGCSSTATVSVTVHPVNQTTVNSPIPPICVGESVSISALGSATYVWSTAATASSITVSPTISTSYSVTGTDANGCITTASTSVTVNPLPTVTASASSTSVCLGNATTLSASGANSYYWSSALGTGSSVSITPSATNSYFVTGTNTFNCSSTASISVTTQALPSVSLSGGGSYCTTRPAINVLVSGGKANYNVTYTTNGASSFTMPAVTATSTALPITADGDYEITSVEDANGCNAATYPAKVSVAKNGSATYTISGGATYCQGQPRADIAINITSLDGPWSLIYNDGTTDHTQAIAVGALPFNITNPAKGIYTVKQITNKDSCIALGDASKSATVTINDTTITTFTGLPASLCDNGKPITLAFSPTPATGETAVISSTSAGVSGSQFFPALSGGAGSKTLLINYTNAAGCKSVTKTSIAVIASPVASIAGAPSFGVCFGLDQVIDASHTTTTTPYLNGWYLSNTLLTADNVEDPTFKGGTPIGTYPLQYIVSDGNGCKDTADISIVVKNKTKPKWINTLPELCTNESSIDLKNFVSPYDANGSFTMDGNPLASTVIDPKIVSATTHPIVYTYAMGTCSDFEDTVLTIKTAPSISLGTYQTEFCDYAAAYTFSSLSPSTGGTLSGTGVTAGTVTFDPKLATTKNTAFNLTYAVTQNGCSDSKLVPVTVWSAPVVTFALPTVACAKDLGINLAAISTPALGTYSVAEGVSGSYFYPKAVTTLGSPIAISYSVSSHGCTTKVDKQITVNKTVVPTVTDASAIVPVTVVPPVTAVGTALKLYGDIPTYPLIDANWSGSYANPANTTAGTYNYWVTQTLNGCVSDSVPVKLTITNCTALTPTGVSASQCFGDAPGALTATGLSQAGMVYRWFLNNTYTGTEGASLPMATGLAVGKYTYNVKIYDPANTCYGAASQPVVYEVKALPAISFSPDTVMCENSAIQDLTAKVVPKAATFWLAGSQIPNFNPAGKIGLNSIELRYTDPTTTCKNNILTTIRVKALPSLTFTPPSTACSNGAVINFTATPSGGTYFGGPLASDGKSVNPKNLALYIATTYNYKYTDPISACSDTISAAITAYDSTKVKIQLSAANANPCINSPAIALTADIAGGNFTVNGIANAGSFDPTSAGNFTIVYKCTNANGCLSSDKATITVHALPTISNTIPPASLAACSNGGPIALTGTPSGLVFSGTAVSSSLAGYTFNTTTAGAGTFPITYSFTDSYSCTNSASVSIAVQDIQPPVVSDQSFYSFNYPKIITATGTNLKWYGKTGKTNFLLAANQLTNADLKAKNYADSLNIASVNPYVFNVSQTIGNCESNLAQINVTINSCTAQAPLISSLTPSSCFGAPFTTITVTTHVKGDVAHWYDANHNLIATGDSFTPSTANLASSNGTSILYVADSLLGEGCKSNFTQIAYTVKFIDKPTITNPSPICETDITGKKLSATGNGGSFLWTYGTQTFNAPDLLLSSAGISSGQATPYNISVVQQKNGCNSDPVLVPVTVSLQPSAPTIPAFFEKCFSIDLFSDITATAGTSGTIGNVKWYSNANLSPSSIVSQNANLLASSLDKSVGTHYYYAVNYQNACYSDATTLEYNVKPLPAMPSGKDQYKCSTWNYIPSLSVTVQSGASAIWYNSQNLMPANVIFNGFNYQPTQADADFYVVASLNGCVGTVPKKIRAITYVAPLPVITASTTALCKGDKITLKATGTSVKWYDETKTAINTTIPSQLDYSWSSEGQHQFYATATNKMPDNVLNCTSEYATAPSITDKKVPQKFAITGLSICPNEAIETFYTNYTGTGTITWQNDKGVNLSTGAKYTPNKADLRIGDFNVFTATLKENGCYGDASKAIIIVHAIVPKPNVIQSPKPYCIGSSAPLQLSTDVLVPIWLDKNNMQTPLDSIIAHAQTIGSFNFKVLQTNANCSSDTLTYTMNSFKTPTPIIEGKDSLCENTVGVPYNISSANQNATSKYVWAVTGNISSYSIDNSKQYRRAIDWMIPGIETISVTETTKDGCMATDTMQVKIAATPTALFTVDNPGQEGAVLFFNRSSQDPITKGTYSEEIPFNTFWNFGHTFDKFTLVPDSMGTYDNPISQNYEYGYYKVAIQVKNDFGCQANYEKEIFIDINTGLYIPNSFVPEATGDGISKFKPVGFNLESYSLTIYDLWGNTVWFTNKIIDGMPAEGWDGTSNGVVMKMDTYIWKIDATFKNDKQWKGDKRNGKVSKFGNVLLLR